MVLVQTHYNVPMSLLNYDLPSSDWCRGSARGGREESNEENEENDSSKLTES